MRLELTPEDVDDITQTIEAVYGNTDTRPESGVIVADGFGVSIYVKNDALTIEDGYQPKRTRTVVRHHKRTNRVIIIGSVGSVTLAALKWCQDTHTVLTNVDRTGRVIALTVNDHHRDARLRRAQARAFGHPVGVDLARYLLRLKINGQRGVLEARLGLDGRSTGVLTRYEQRLEAATDLQELRKVEARMAGYYFSKWVGRTPIRWKPGDALRVPEHWNNFSGRQSPLASASPFKAIDPMNSALNYAYALGATECVHACHRLGLDPELGIIHTDEIRRDSMALDLLETIRPTIDNAVLRLFQEVVWKKTDFVNTRDGVCRLTETVSHPLVNHLPHWREVLAPHAEHIAHEIAGKLTPAKLTKRTPLTLNRQHAGNKLRTWNPLTSTSDRDGLSLSDSESARKT